MIYVVLNSRSFKEGNISQSKNVPHQQNEALEFSDFGHLKNTFRILQCQHLGTGQTKSSCLLHLGRTKCVFKETCIFRVNIVKDVTEQERPKMSHMKTVITTGYTYYVRLYEQNRAEQNVIVITCNLHLILRVFKFRNKLLGCLYVQMFTLC